MQGRNVRYLVIVMALSLALATACMAFKTSRQYSITIYVDEGHCAPNGHVFIGLSDGAHTFHYGFYAKNKALALAAMGGGKVRDDSDLAESKWDVKKRYTISYNGYGKAIEAIDDWRRSGKAWSVNSHCGDFAESVAKAAGVDISLPQQKSGRTRPGLFGEYLRKNAGIVRKDAGLLVPDPNPALAPLDFGDIDLNGSWASNDYEGGKEVVIIRHYGSTISAVKTKGNKFVPAGAVTWQGDYTGRSFPGKARQSYVDGNGKITKTYLIDVVIDVIDADNIAVSGWSGEFPNKRYRRVSS